MKIGNTRREEKSGEKLLHPIPNMARMGKRVMKQRNTLFNFFAGQVQPCISTDSVNRNIGLNEGALVQIISL